MCRHGPEKALWGILGAGGFPRERKSNLYGRYNPRDFGCGLSRIMQANARFAIRGGIATQFRLVARTGPTLYPELDGSADP